MICNLFDGCVRILSEAESQYASWTKTWLEWQFITDDGTRRVGVGAGIPLENNPHHFQAVLSMCRRGGAGEAGSSGRQPGTKPDKHDEVGG